MHRLKATTSAARTRDGRWDWRMEEELGGFPLAEHVQQEEGGRRRSGLVLRRPEAGVVDRIDTGGSIASGWMLGSGCLLVWWRTDRGTRKWTSQLPIKRILLKGVVKRWSLRGQGAD